MALAECGNLPEQSIDERLQVIHWQRQTGNTAAAARLLGELLRTHPGSAAHPGYAFERYELARAQGEKKQAQALLEALANGPDSDDSGRAQLLLYLQSDSPAQQTAWLRRYIDNPAHGKDWATRTLGLAIDEFSAGRHDASLDWAQRLVRTGNPTTTWCMARSISRDASSRRASSRAPPRSTPISAATTATAITG